MIKKMTEMTRIAKTESKSKQQSFDSMMDGDESNQISANIFEVLCLFKFTNLFRNYTYTLPIKSFGSARFWKKSYLTQAFTWSKIQ